MQRRYFRIRLGVIKLQSCAQRLFLFCDENNIPDELIVAVMELRCNRINNKINNYI
jgi:hypothetical protein